MSTRTTPARSVIRSHAAPRRSVRVGWLVVALVMGGCSAPDPFPRAPEGEPPPVRPSDGLLRSPVLQEVVEATLARDGGALIRWLDDADPLIRARAAYGLASVQTMTAIPRLERLLDDPEARVRSDAAFALGQIEGGVRVALLDALAVEEDREARAALIEAVGKGGGPAALSVLLALDDPTLLASSTLALSRGAIRGAHPPGAVDTLVARLSHPRAEVREAAAYFAARAEVDVWWGMRIRVREALVSYGLDDPAAMHLIRGLGQRMTVFAHPIVFPFLTGSPDWRIRANAVQALAEQGAIIPANALLLVEAMDDPSPHVREAAATGLAVTPPTANVQILLSRWLDANPDESTVIAPLLPVLGRIGEGDRALALLRRLPPDDLTSWQLAMELFDVLPGDVTVRELGAQVRRSDLSAAVGRLLARGLQERWEVARAFPEGPELFLEVLGEVVRDAPGDRVVILAPVLLDPVLRGRGGETALRDARARLPRGEAGDSLERLLEGDPVGEGDDPGADENAPSTPPSPVERLEVDWEYLAGLGAEPRLVLETTKGTVVLRLLPESAPLSVQSLARLADAGRHDGVPFHRVVPNFVVQGGDVGWADGTAGPGYRIRSELTRTPYLRGVLGMARGPALDSEGSQYFVTHSMQPHLDGDYTAFGWVERGMEVVDLLTRGDRVLRAKVIPTR